MHDKPLGFIAAKYESGEGKIRAGTIGNIHGDPGGKSYGVFQISLNTGTLRKYLALTKYFEIFKGIPLGGKDFDNAWMKLAFEDEAGFTDDQFHFIKQVHFTPAITYAHIQGFSSDHRAIQEPVFSISVQHGGYKKVIKTARQYRRSKALVDQVKALYDARKDYVKSLRTLPPPLKTAVLNRYVRELDDVLALV